MAEIGHAEMMELTGRDAPPPTRTRGRKPSGGPGSCGGMMGKAWFRLPQEHADAVTAIAAQRGCSTGEIYGEAVTRYLAQQVHQ